MSVRPRGRRRQRGERRRRVLRTVSTVLVLAGGMIIFDGGLTVLWQEPVTAFLAGAKQGALRDDFAHLREAGPTPLELKALAGLRGEESRRAYLARSLRRRTAEGDALGRLRIPAIGLDKVIVNGSGPGALRVGPGVYDDSPLPGTRGTVAIAGHRTTYGAPFRHLDGVDPGDDVTVDMPYGTFVYRVERTRIVKPSALWVLRKVRYDRLVLSACHPLFSAAERIVVFARLERIDPVRGKGDRAGDWTTVGAPARTGQRAA